MSDNRNYSNRGSRGNRGGGRRFYSRPRSCQFCSDSNLKIDYKDADFLKRFIMEDGRIRPRRQTGNCAKHQRRIAVAVKRARHIALLPYTGEVLR